MALADGITRSAAAQPAPGRAAAPLYINGRFLTQAPSGVQRFATEIAAALRRIHVGDVAVLAPPGTRAVDLREPDLREPDLRATGLREVGRRRGHLWEQLDLPRHAGGGVLLNLGNAAPLALRSQIVVLHDAGPFSTPEAYGLGYRVGHRAAQRWLARAGARIVTVSEFSRGELARQLGLRTAAIAVVGEGADHMQRIVAEPAALARFGLQPGGFVLAVGNLAAHKNLAALGDLARALAVRQMPLVIVGARPGSVFASGAGPTLPARHLGRVSDGALKALYQAAACLVLPSRYEGFGLPAIEAMACRCPVVAADIPALRETCRDAALFCDPWSPPDITAVVLRLLDDALLRERLRRAGVFRAAACTWDGAARALDRVVTALAGA